MRFLECMTVWRVAAADCVEKGRENKPHPEARDTTSIHQQRNGTSLYLGSGGSSCRSIDGLGGGHDLFQGGYYRRHGLLLWGPRIERPRNAAALFVSDHERNPGTIREEIVDNLPSQHQILAVFHTAGSG